jgi:hypothetical protein
MGLCTIGAVVGLAGAFVLGRQASSLLLRRDRAVNVTPRATQ